MTAISSNGIHLFDKLHSDLFYDLATVLTPISKGKGFVYYQNKAEQIDLVTRVELFFTTMWEVIKTLGQALKTTHALSKLRQAITGKSEAYLDKTESSKDPLSVKNILLTYPDLYKHFSYLPESVRNDKNIMQQAYIQSANLGITAPESQLPKITDRAILLESLGLSGEVLEYADPSFHKDIECVALAIKNKMSYKPFILPFLKDYRVVGLIDAFSHMELKNYPKVSCSFYFGGDCTNPKIKRDLEKWESLTGDFHPFELVVDMSSLDAKGNYALICKDQNTKISETLSFEMSKFSYFLRTREESFLARFVELKKQEDLKTFFIHEYRKFEYETFIKPFQTHQMLESCQELQPTQVKYKNLNFFLNEGRLKTNKQFWTEIYQNNITLSVSLDAGQDIMPPGIKKIKFDDLEIQLVDSEPLKFGIKAKTFLLSKLSKKNAEGKTLKKLVRHIEFKNWGKDKFSNKTELSRLINYMNNCLNPSTSTHLLVTSTADQNRTEYFAQILAYEKEGGQKSLGAAALESYQQNTELYLARSQEQYEALCGLTGEIHEFPYRGCQYPSGDLNEIKMPVPLTDIVGKIFRGKLPTLKTCEDWAKKLQDNQVNNVVLLLTEDDWKKELNDLDLVKWYEEKGINVIKLPIPDFNVPDKNETLACLIKVLELTPKGSNTVFHCKSGIGRTGTVLACYLKKLFASFNIQYNPITYLRHFVPGAVENSKQIEFVKNF